MAVLPWRGYSLGLVVNPDDWVEVEIGIPETWWRLAHTDEFKKRLAQEVENGFISMIDLLRSNRRDIKAESLLKDSAKIKSKFLKPKVKVQ